MRNVVAVPVIEDLRRDQAASNRPTLAGVPGRPVDEDGSVQVAEELSAVHRVRSNRANGYSLRLVLADFRCSGPLPTILRFLNDTTVPGARLPSTVRRRPVPVST